MAYPSTDMISRACLGCSLFLLAIGWSTEAAFQSGRATTFITPSPSGQRPPLRPTFYAFQPLRAVQVKRVIDLTETEAVTAFFVDNFWPEPIPKPMQKQQLQMEVYRDLSKRYVQVDNSKQNKACLLVAREGGRIVGCVGIESRTLRNGKLSSPGTLLDTREPGVILRPVIANLAVDRSIRRRGIGKKLLRECEAVVTGWGQEELYLVVDEKNSPALKLYESMGYKGVYRDKRGTKVVPTEWQLRELKVTNLCMSKPVKKPAVVSFSILGGLFGNR